MTRKPADVFHQLTILFLSFQKQRKLILFENIDYKIQLRGPEKFSGSFWNASLERSRDCRKRENNLEEKIDASILHENK